MTRFTEEQLRQQWMWKQLTPEQQQAHRNRSAQRASQPQYGQPQGHQQQPPQPQQQQDGQPEGQLSPQQQQHLRQQWQLRQQQNAQRRKNPTQFPAQSVNNTQLPGSGVMAPPSSPNRIGVFSQAQAPPRSLPNASSSNILSSANIIMTGNGQQQRHGAAQSPSINGNSVARPYAPSPLSVPSPTPTLTRTTSSQNGAMGQKSTNATSPAQYGKPSAPDANSHTPTLSPSPSRTQSAGTSQQRQQNARFQQSPPKQGHAHAQTKQQFTPSHNGRSPTTGQKRQATDAPEGARPADKRPNLIAQSGTGNHATLIRQTAATSHQPDGYRRANGIPNGAPNGVAPNTRDLNSQHREQQAKLEAQREAERRHKREYQARVAAQARVAEEHQAACAAALQREKDHKRRQELRNDPSANFRHIHEVYKLMPLAKGELPNRYLTGLLANRPMPMDVDSDLALAITFAKDHWDYYGQWPKDLRRFVDYEKERRAKKPA